MIKQHQVCLKCDNLSTIRCRGCGKTSKQYDPGLVQKIRDLRDIYLRCRKFKQISCGIVEIDIQMKEIWGDWK